MMYTDYENNQIDAEYPYDVMVYHENPDLNFNKEKEILDSSSGIKQSHEYNIYQNQSSYMNNWLYCNLYFLETGLRTKTENLMKVNWKKKMIMMFIIHTTHI